MPWLELLIALLALAAGLTIRDVVDVIGKTGRRTELNAPLDFTAAAVRGELLRLDWDDPRPVLIPHDGSPAESAAAERVGSAIQDLRATRR